MCLRLLDDMDPFREDESGNRAGNGECMSEDFESIDDVIPRVTASDGTLYFMREVDYLTGETFDYFKIGIVRGEKDVLVREKQHNTGNPRNVVTHTELVCAEVQTLETRLHNRFARHRVSSNEWFFLPGGLLDEVVTAACRYRDQIDAAHAIALAAEAAAALPRSGAILSPNESIVSSARQLIIRTAEHKVLDSNAKAITQRLRTLLEADASLQPLMKRYDRAASRSFNVAMLKKLAKDLHAQFSIPQDKLIYELIFEDEDAEAEALAVRGKLEVAHESLEALDAYALHQEYLRLWGEIDRVKAEIAALNDQLLVACGDATAIDGVLEWQVRTTNRFDKAKFMAEYPDLYEQCQKDNPARTTYSVAEWASYRLQ